MTWGWRFDNDLCHLILTDWYKKGAQAGFTTRKGGFSSGDYESLNMALHVGDTSRTVLDNREKVAVSFGFDSNQMVCAQQIHGKQVAVVGKEDAGRGFYDHADSLAGCDGIVTNRPGIILTLFFADCIPIYLFDPVRKAVGLIHSGWKGTALRIAEAGITALEKNFRCRPGDLQVFIGPGIGPECFAINEERLRQVRQAFAWSEKVIYSDAENHYYWDLPLTNELIIRDAGVPEENITSCRICTACNQELFFSYRGAGGRTGRMGAVLGLLD